MTARKRDSQFRAILGKWFFGVIRPMKRRVSEKKAKLREEFYCVSCGEQEFD
jgi:hypothetical protein